LSDRDKDVMVYRYDPKKKYFLVTLHLENRPGALGNLANLLGIRGINILEGFFGGISRGDKGSVGFFLESTNQRMDEAWLKEFLSTSVMVSDVEVKGSVEGFIVDSLNFPITWNNGDRAVLMRVEGLRAMLESAKLADRVNGPAMVYAQGFSYGITAWTNLLEIHTPKTKAGLAEMLRIYTGTGWGKLELVDVDPTKKSAKLRMTEGFECVGLSTGKAEGSFIVGHLAGAFSALFGSVVKAKETKCLSMGDDACQVEVFP
jgi:V4R domain